MAQLEIEYKTLLSKEDYYYLKKYFSTPQITQTNYYFDTDDFSLKQHKLSLRIRVLDHRAELTLKVPQDVGNVEHNAELPLQLAEDVIAGAPIPENDIYHIISGYGIDPSKLNVWGELTTKRLEEKTPIGLMALDENHYANKIDYELELEVTDAAKGQADFDAFLKQQDIPFQYAKSKVARLANLLFQ